MKYVETKDAPKPIGPYSQGVKVKAQEMLFISGQIPLDPVSGKMVNGDIEEQVEQVFKNLDAILASANMLKSQIVKVEIFLLDMKEFPRVNERYARWLEGARPARQTVEVSALPGGAGIEISCIVVV